MAIINKLILGCGETKRAGAIHVDANPLTEPDVLHDLNQFPYPFEDSSVESIEAFHVIEHLEDPFVVMKELHRILIPNGELHIKVPHCSRGFTHSQHKAGFDVAFPLYFSNSYTKAGYFGVNYSLEKMELHWLGNMHLLKYIGVPSWQISILKTLNSVLSKLANLNPYICSRFWVFYVGGFDEIEFIFHCNKEPDGAKEGF